MIDRQDFETGLILGLASPPVPYVVRPVPKGDVLDNEWPIEWTSRGTADNKAYIQGDMMSMRRVSDAVDFDYENAAVVVTALPDSGGEVTFTTRNIGTSTWDLGVLIHIQCTYGGNTYWVILSVAERAGTFGSVEFDKGTYYAFLDNSMQNIQFSDADLQFKLTAPQLVGYMYNDVGPLPKLPEVEGCEFAGIVYSSAGSETEGWKLVGLSLSENPGIRTKSGYFYVIHATGKVRYYQLVNSNAIKDEYVRKELGVHDNVTEAEVWTYCEEYEYTEPGSVGGSTWTNYDVMNEDGSTYMVGSEPVPVYE